jgi:hypothetical protein
MIIDRSSFITVMTPVGWPNGKALDYESRDCRFDPCVDHLFASFACLDAMSLRRQIMGRRDAQTRTVLDSNQFQPLVGSRVSLAKPCKR